MLRNLQKFFRDLTLGENDETDYEIDDPRLCAAALLVHIISVDGIVDDAEREKLRQVLKNNYDLDDEGTTELIEEAGTFAVPTSFPSGGVTHCLYLLFN